MKHIRPFAILQSVSLIPQNSLKRILLLLNIILFIITLTGSFSCKTGLSRKKITDIKKGDHGYLVFTMPSKKETGTNINWQATVNIDNELFFSGSFKQGETYRVPIPEGRHKISYSIYARSIEPFRGQTTYITSDSMWNIPFKELDIDAKKDHIISFSFRRKGKRLVNWPRSCYYTIVSPIMWPLGFWPLFRQPMLLVLEKDEAPLSGKKKTTLEYSGTIGKNLVLGTISQFIPGNKVVLTVKKRFLELLHPGRIILTFQNNRTVGKLVVTQISQTNIIAKIIISQAALSIGMQYGIITKTAVK